MQPKRTYAARTLRARQNRYQRAKEQDKQGLGLSSHFAVYDEGVNQPFAIHQSASERRRAFGRAIEDDLQTLARNTELSIAALRSSLSAIEIPITPAVASGVVATDNAWRAMDAEFGLLTAPQVAELLGSKAKGRGYASDKRKAGQLIGVRRANTIRYPGFQFDTQRSAVREVIPRLIEVVVKQYKRSEEDLAQWMCIPSGYLNDARPVDRLDEPDAVLAAAEGHYGVTW